MIFVSRISHFKWKWLKWKVQGGPADKMSSDLGITFPFELNEPVPTRLVQEEHTEGPQLGSKQVQGFASALATTSFHSSRQSSSMQCNDWAKRRAFRYFAQIMCVASQVQKNERGTVSKQNCCQKHLPGKWKQNCTAKKNFSFFHSKQNGGSCFLPDRIPKEQVTWIPWHVLRLCSRRERRCKYNSFFCLTTSRFHSQFICKWVPCATRVISFFLGCFSFYMTVWGTSSCLIYKHHFASSVFCVKIFQQDFDCDLGRHTEIILQI